MKYPITLLGSDQAALMHSSQTRACRSSGGKGSVRHKSSDVKPRGVSAGLPVEAPPVLLPVLLVFVTNQVMACSPQGSFIGTWGIKGESHC